MAAAASERAYPGPTSPPALERIKHRRDGPYYIAPDSAEPLPNSIWQRIDLSVLEASVARGNAKLDEATARPDAECLVEDPARPERATTIASSGPKAALVATGAVARARLAISSAVSALVENAGARRR
jgi:hypothetical protein